MMSSPLFTLSSRASHLNSQLDNHLVSWNRVKNYFFNENSDDTYENQVQQSTLCNNGNKLTSSLCISMMDDTAVSVTSDNITSNHNGNQQCVSNDSNTTNNNQSNNPTRPVTSSAYLTSRQDHLSSNAVNGDGVASSRDSSSDTLSRSNSLSTLTESPIASPYPGVSMSSQPPLHPSSSHSLLIDTTTTSTNHTTHNTTPSSLTVSPIVAQIHLNSSEINSHNNHSPLTDHLHVATVLSTSSPLINSQQQSTSNDTMALHMHTMSQRSTLPLTLPHAHQHHHHNHNHLNSSHHQPLQNHFYQPTQHLSPSLSHPHSLLSPMIQSPLNHNELAFISTSSHQTHHSPSPRHFTSSSESSHSTAPNSDPSRPFLTIVEEPINRIRYRYKSEKGSHGGLAGERNSQSKRTFPTVRLENYHRNPKNIIIKAYLVTNESTHKPHVHKLMGRNCTEDGICKSPLGENYTSVFQNLGILFVGKKEVPEILYQRKLEEFKILRTLQDTNCTLMISDCERNKLREEAEKDAKYMNLNCVRIAFEAYDCTHDINYPIAGPIYSRAVANQKSPDSGELKIVRMDKHIGSVRGNEEIFLLCEKVNKKEIKIRFFQLDNNGRHSWYAFGSFAESDVHHQVAIVFRTPQYHSLDIIDPVDVYVQLYRERDGECSEAKIFTYYPDRSKRMREFVPSVAPPSPVSSDVNNGDNSYHLTTLQSAQHALKSSLLDKNNEQLRQHQQHNNSHRDDHNVHLMQHKLNDRTFTCPISVSTSGPVHIKQENKHLHESDERSCNSNVNNIHHPINEHSNHSPLYIVSSTASMITPEASNCTTNSDSLFYSTC